MIIVRPTKLLVELKITGAGADDAAKRTDEINK